MHAVLRYIHSPDAPDLDGFEPDDSASFRLFIQAFFGPDDGPGEESFGFLVCTPKWLEQELWRAEYIFGKHYLIVAKYDLELIESTIKALCLQVEGDNWSSVAEKLSRYAYWEFEDYREAPDQ